MIWRPRYPRILVVNRQDPSPNVLAFPGAQGFARYTKGGRGGVNYYVTHTGDPRDGSSPSEGSYRTAVEASEPRNVIFKVSGTVFNEEPVVIDSPYCSVLGQTAPGDGFCVAGEETRIQAKEVIFRHIRHTRGDTMPARDGFEDADALNIGDPDNIGGVFNIYLDHVSMRWSIDETLNLLFRCYNISVGWCLMAEALMNSLHPEGGHSMGPNFSAKCVNISLFNNLIAHCNQRNFQAAGANIIQAFNNVVYNWGQKNCEYKNKDQRLDFVGNWYQYGPDTITPPTGTLVVDESDVGALFYARGNRDPRGDASIDLDNWQMIQTVGGEQIPESFKDGHWSLSPVVNGPPIFEERADLAKLHVLTGCGATRPTRDSADTRIVNTVFNGTGAIIDSQADVGGWPTLNSAAYPTDSDDDGIPDWYEDLHGLNKNLAADANIIEDGQPYTWLERYSHYLAGDPGAT